MTPTRLFDLLYQQQQKFPQPDALASKVNGRWQRFSTEEVIDIVNQISIALLKKGIRKGDKVAIVSPNRPEWIFADYAIQQLGAVSVPMYPTISEEDYNYILKDAGAIMAFVADEELYTKVKNASAEMPELNSNIYTFDKLNIAPHWKTLLKEAEGEAVEQLDEHKAAVEPDDLLTLIYTSGTTGRPKGVMLTHHNILSNAQAVSRLFPNIGAGHRSLSFLPLCHIFERTATYAYMNMGICIYYAESMETIGDNLKEVQPQVFATVPRLLEKVYDKIVAKGMELTGIKRKLFFWALDLGNSYVPSKPGSFWYRLQLKIANKLIFSKWREALGGDVRMIVSGAAALQPRLARVFWAGQIPVCEAYGLTETSPGISFNKCDAKRVRVGTVGEVLEGITVKIADDGEILVKGPNIMKGYYNKPDLTNEAIDSEGWFHTGDVGEMVEGKFLKITDRKKEMFKTSGGKYIAPQPIENKMKESTMIEQIMVIGEGERFPAALVVASKDNLIEWCKHKGIDCNSDYNQLIRQPQIIDKIEREIQRLNKSFGHWEQVKQVRLVENPWSIESGELTPTLKLKRKIIADKNKGLIEAIYREGSTKPVEV